MFSDARSEKLSFIFTRHSQKFWSKNSLVIHSIENLGQNIHSSFTRFLWRKTPTESENFSSSESSHSFSFGFSAYDRLHCFSWQRRTKFCEIFLAFSLFSQLGKQKSTNLIWKLILVHNMVSFQSFGRRFMFQKGHLVRKIHNIPFRLDN